MAISEEQVRHVATLARLALTDEQVATLSTELSTILDHVGDIRSLNLESVEPTAHALAVANSMRQDILKPGLTQAEALLNAPEAEGGAFVIPRIVGVGGEE